MPTSIYINFLDEGGQSSGITTGQAHRYLRDIPDGGSRGIRSFIEVIIPDDIPVTWSAIETVIRRGYEQIGTAQSDSVYTKNVPGGRLDLLLHEGSPATADEAFALLRAAATEVLTRGRTIELNQ